MSGTLRHFRDDYQTNVFGQVIILIEDITDGTIEFLDDVKEQIENAINI